MAKTATAKQTSDPAAGWKVAFVLSLVINGILGVALAAVLVSEPQVNQSDCVEAANTAYLLGKRDGIRETMDKLTPLMPTSP